MTAGTNLEATISIAVTPSINSPAPLGTLIHWSTAVKDTGSGTLWYRFRSAEPVGASRGRMGTTFQTIVDYGPTNYLDWTVMNHEGSYLIEASVEDKTTGESATVVVPYAMKTRLTSANAPVISPTANPLVFLYSAPGCSDGSQMFVEFTSPEGVVSKTPSQACHSRTSMNFYLAGMRAKTTYRVQHTIVTGTSSKQGPMLTVTTGAISITVPTYNVYMPQVSATSGILLQCGLEVPTLATDLAGNVVWYYNGPITFATRAEPGGYFLGLYENTTADPSQEYFVKFDLAGTILAETNAARVNEQLAAMGRNAIDAFHHEVRLLPNGGYLVLADTEKILTNVQGPGPVDVIGDEILVLSPNLDVLWAWDSFDHLDTSRMAVLGETCPSGAGCAPYHLAATANDWLHGNSLQLTPDGQILYSSRHQDWLFKINYSNGSGDGAVIWRLGLDGDFQIVSSDPYPWFSHQHDAGIVATANGYNVSVFDDGNTRVAANPGENSRGQIYHLDEQNRIATLVLNADCGAYAYALGTAQLLPNGNYNFDAGWISQDSLGGSNTSRSLEVDPAGNVVFGVAISTPEYRTFRMPDLYTPQD